MAYRDKSQGFGFSFPEKEIRVDEFRESRDPEPEAEKEDSDLVYALKAALEFAEGGEWSEDYIIDALLENLASLKKRK